jgi:hypothetical protein
MFRGLDRGKLRAAAAAATAVVTVGYFDSGLAKAAPSCPSEISAMDSLAAIASVAMPAGPLILGRSEVSLQLTAQGDRAMAQRLKTIVRSGTGTVVLQLKCVQADRAPGAMWEVYVGLPANTEPIPESPYFVGNVAMFGDGVKSESAGKPFAEFIFPLNRAIAAAADVSTLTVTFVPSSGVVAVGHPTAPTVMASVRIGKIDLLLDRNQQ